MMSHGAVATDEALTGVIVGARERNLLAGESAVGRALNILGDGQRFGIEAIRGGLAPYLALLAEVEDELYADAVERGDIGWRHGADLARAVELGGGGGADFSQAVYRAQPVCVPKVICLQLGCSAMVPRAVPIS